MQFTSFEGVAGILLAVLALVIFLDRKQHPKAYRLATLRAIPGWVLFLGPPLFKWVCHLTGQDFVVFIAPVGGGRQVAQTLTWLLLNDQGNLCIAVGGLIGLASVLLPSRAERQLEPAHKYPHSDVPTQVLIDRLQARTSSIYQDPYEHGDTIIDGIGLTEPLTAFIAPFRIRPGTIPPRESEVTLSARVDYYKGTYLIAQVDNGIWVGEGYNFATIGVNGTASLVLGIIDGNGVKVIQDDRHSTEKSYGIKSKVLLGQLVAKVSLVDYNKGHLLGDHSYLLNADPPTLAAISNPRNGV